MARCDYVGVRKTMKKKTYFCSRCKKELDWETKEIIKKMSKEELIRMVFGFMDDRVELRL